MKPAFWHPPWRTERGTWLVHETDLAKANLNDLLVFNSVKPRTSNDGKVRVWDVVFCPVPYKEIPTPAKIIETQHYVRVTNFPPLFSEKIDIGIHPAPHEIALKKICDIENDTLDKWSLRTFGRLMKRPDVWSSVYTYYKHALKASRKYLFILNRFDILNRFSGGGGNIYISAYDLHITGFKFHWLLHGYVRTEIRRRSIMEKIRDTLYAERMLERRKNGIFLSREAERLMHAVVRDWRHYISCLD